MDVYKKPVRNVQFWRCPCGKRFRAVTELTHPASRFDFSCPSCGVVTEVDGKPLQISYQVGEAWFMVVRER